MYTEPFPCKQRLYNQGQEDHNRVFLKASHKCLWIAAAVTTTQTLGCKERILVMGETLQTLALGTYKGLAIW